MVQETEHYLGNLNPRFLPFEITGARLCKNNLNAALKFELFDFREDGFHVSLGSGFATAQDLMKGQASVLTSGGKINFACISPPCFHSMSSKLISVSVSSRMVCLSRYER